MWYKGTYIKIYKHSHGFGQHGRSKALPTSLLWRKIPMAWGVPQQTEKSQKSIPSQYEREIKHLTLKYLETYLIPDG